MSLGGQTSERAGPLSLKPLSTLGPYYDVFLRNGDGMVSNRSWTKVLFLTAISVAMLTLAGCGTAEGNITLYQGGRWEGDFDFSVPREMLTLAGGEAALDAEMQAGMEKEMAEAQGVQFSWQKTRSDDEGITYRFSMAGNDLESLNAALEDDGEVWVEEGPGGKRLINFRFTPDAEGTMMRFRFSLTGGEIISSNADRIEGGTATWYDLSGGRTAEATLTEAPTGPLGGFFLPLLGGLALIGVVVIAAVAFLGMRRPLKPSPAPVARFCTQCGTRNAPTARFCIKCGKGLAG